MLENPQFLQAMVQKTGAQSTDLQSPESVEHLCGKCSHYAEEWQQTADKLWAENHHFSANFKNYKSDYEK